ncbi:MAG: hypothetical protein Q9225_000960 [Loekoesia sp. 1 TL-2023]
MASSNGLGQQTSGFAADARHTRHLPTPVITRHSKMSHRGNGEILEPQPKRSLPSLGQVIDAGERGSSFDTVSIRGGPTPGSTPIPEAWRDLPNTPRPAFDADAVLRKAMETMNEQIRANGFDPNNLPINNRPINNASNYPGGNAADNQNEDVQCNPYQERADQIGLSHRIPGVGHLGDLLTPPGWKPGDEPIPPNRLRQLLKEAYDAAKKKLDDSIAEFKHLKGTAFQEASDLKNEEWQNVTDLNKLIFDERVKVHQAHEDQKKNEGQARTQNLPVLNLPQSGNAYQQGGPAMSVVPARNPQINRPVPRPLILSRPASGLDKPFPSPQMLSPSLLDPNLVPGTVQAVIQTYHARKLQIKQLQQENELRLNRYLAKYGPHLGPGYQVAHQAHIHPQHHPHQSHPYLGLNSGQLNNGYHKENQGLTANRYAVPPNQNALGLYDEPTELALTPVKNRDHEAMTDITEEQAQPVQAAETSMQSKKKAPTKKASPKKPTSKSATTKKEPWYASDLAAANLPTSIITPEAIQAGLAYDPKRPSKTAPSSQPPKKRRRGSEPVPVPEFKVPVDKIRALFKSGLPVRYTGMGPNPYIDGGDAGGKAPVVPAMGSGKGKGAPVVPAMSSTGGSAKGSKAKAGASASSPMLVDDNLSDSTAESHDDPNDETYGARRKSGATRASTKGKSTRTKRARREEEEMEEE